MHHFGTFVIRDNNYILMGNERQNSKWFAKQYYILSRAFMFYNQTIRIQEKKVNVVFRWAGEWPNVLHSSNLCFLEYICVIGANLFIYETLPVDLVKVVWVLAQINFTGVPIWHDRHREILVTKTYKLCYIKCSVSDRSGKSSYTLLLGDCVE